MPAAGDQQVDLEVTQSHVSRLPGCSQPGHRTVRSELPMARSMWKGVISFGMVSIPVRLYVATESHSVTFRQLCAEHLSPIKYKRWCMSGDHEVAYADIVKGYEVGADNYVVIQDSELDNMPLPTARSIAIGEFVPNEDIEGGLYFKSAYYIEPEQAGLKPYHLLRRALAETGMTAVAKIAFRERELQMAKALVENLAEERFDPNRFHDDYHEALMEVVNAKVQGQEVVAAPEVDAAPAVMDLMEALKASVDQAKKQRTAKARTARKPAAAKKAAAAG